MGVGVAYCEVDNRDMWEQDIMKKEGSTGVLWGGFSQKSGYNESPELQSRSEKYEIIPLVGQCRNYW